MAERDRAEHDFLGEELGFGLDHEHRVRGAGDDEVEIGRRKLGLRRIEQVLTVRPADARGADRTLERNTGERQRSRRAEQRGNVAVDFGVHRKHGRDDLHFVLELFGEQRTHRTIDETRGERLLLGRTAFALEEAARNAAGRVELFLIVDGEREEVLPFARFGRGDGGDEDNGAAHADDDGAACLARDFARFERDVVIAVPERPGNFCHVIFFLIDETRPLDRISAHASIAHASFEKCGHGWPRWTTAGRTLKRAKPLRTRRSGRTQKLTTQTETFDQRLCSDRHPCS